jgi:hypothetical protein
LAKTVTKEETLALASVVSHRCASTRSGLPDSLAVKGDEEGLLIILTEAIFLPRECIKATEFPAIITLDDSQSITIVIAGIVKVSHPPSVSRRSIQQNALLSSGKKSFDVLEVVVICDESPGEDKWWNCWARNVQNATVVIGIDCACPSLG